MTSIILLIALAAEAPLQCTKTDALCWARLYDAESDKTALLQSGYDAAKRLAKDNDERAETWKKAFQEVKPKPPTILESPVFWLVVGVVVGAGATIAITYAVNQPR